MNVTAWARVKNLTPVELTSRLNLYCNCKRCYVGKNQNCLNKLGIKIKSFVSIETFVQKKNAKMLIRSTKATVWLDWLTDEVTWRCPEGFPGGRGRAACVGSWSWRRGRYSEAALTSSRKLGCGIWCQSHPKIKLDHILIEMIVEEENRRNISLYICTCALRLIYRMLLEVLEEIMKLTFM